MKIFFGSTGILSRTTSAKALQRSTQCTPLDRMLPFCFACPLLTGGLWKSKSGRNSNPRSSFLLFTPKKWSREGRLPSSSRGDLLLRSAVAAGVGAEGQFGSGIGPVGQVHGRVAVEKAHWLQREADALVGHDGEILGAGDMGEAEGVPDHWIMPWTDFPILKSTTLIMIISCWQVLKWAMHLSADAART